MTTVGAAIALLVGLLIALPVDCFPALQHFAAHYPTIDGSWRLELPARMFQGELAGRDIYYVYGPFFQILHGVGLLFPGGDLASLVRFQNVPEALLAALSVWAMLALTGAPLAWRVPPYLLWICLFGAALKPLVGLLALMACGYWLLGPSAGGLLLWSGCAVVLGAFSFDLGIFSLLAQLLFAAAMLACTWSLPSQSAAPIRKRVLLAGAAAAGGVGLSAGVLALAGRWSHYLPMYLGMARAHTNAVVIACPTPRLLGIAAAAAGAAVVLLGACRWLRHYWRAKTAVPPAGLAIIAGACYCLLWTRYGLSRSDAWHALDAQLPIVFLLACLLPCFLRGIHSRMAGPALALWLCPMLALSPFLAPQSLPGVITQRITGALAALSKLEWRPAGLSVEDPVLAEAAPVARQLPGRSLYVWPYQTIVNLLADKHNPSVLLQSFMASDDYLEKLTVDELAAVPQLPVMIFYYMSQGLDNIENLTRTPRIFRYFLDHYELARPPYLSFVLLQRAGPGHRPWQEQELAIPPQFYEPARGLPLRIQVSPGACRASDLLQLRLQATATHSFGIGKPGQLIVTFRLTDDRQISRNVLLPQDGQPHDVLVSALTIRDPLFFSMFAADRQWRATEGVSAIQVQWVPLDLLSRQPHAIALQKVSVLRRAVGQVRESTLAGQAQPDLRHWCFQPGH